MYDWDWEVNCFLWKSRQWKVQDKNSTVYANYPAYHFVQKSQVSEWSRQISIDKSETQIDIS